MAVLALATPGVCSDELKFFNNWFLTGDYAVGGVGLADKGGTGTLNVTANTPIDPSTGAPAQAYPVAAFLYWQTVENRSGQASPAANGILDGSAIVGRLLGSDTSSACWLPANQSQTLRVYRADVLRFLPLDPATHLRRISGAHTVSLGQAVAANSGVLATEGASLVVIYRVVAPGSPAIAPLRSVVIYDGVRTLRRGDSNFNQKIAGYYQASSTPRAFMTHIAGNGQAADRETLRIDNDVPQGVSSTNPFAGAQGKNWDNLTFGFRPHDDDDSHVDLSVSASGDSNCLSWGAIITAVNVKDSDGDGLLDVWESRGMHRNTQAMPATFGTCDQYAREACVNLPAMGARNGVKDIFLQLDWMHGYGDGTGGVDGSGLHLHKPKLEALTMVARAFAAKGIAVHFDVGDSYQGLLLNYIVPYTRDANGNQLAQGGADIDEATLACVDTPGHACLYHEPYPVLSFKLGFASVKDGNRLLNLPARFSPLRRDIFHYGLFAHALAGPYTLTGAPADSHPRSISGVADRPGGDLMITLGLWRSDIPANDQVGSVLVQAGTLMHELGHNLGLSHAGSTSAPNCMPNYPSVMSYLYQTRGLTDASGVPQIDFSNGLLGGLNESALSMAALGPLPYRLRYYAPFNALLNSAGQTAKVHCDGTPIQGDAPLVRLEAAALATPDWSNGTLSAGYTSLPLDLNFDGVPGQLLQDRRDWASINLLQIGSRANFGSISAGSLATDAGSLATDAGSLATDAGSLATDVGSLATDAGSLATDAGDEDYDSHIRSTTDSLPTPQQCAGCGLKAAGGLSGVTLSWTPPDVGGTLTYNVYRCSGANCVPQPPALATGWTPASKAAPTYADAVNDFVHAEATCPANRTCYNTPYTYAVTAVSSAGVESPYSNPAGGEVVHLFVLADSQSVVYGSANPAPTFKTYGKVEGSLSPALVSCNYSGVPRNAGTYAITCTGPATTGPANGVSYNAPYLANVAGALTILPRPITVTAAASSKFYDGNVSSPAVPTPTAGTLAYDDTAAWTETYDNKNAGTNHVMTPAGAVNDGNGGANYLVTFAPIGNGEIKKANAAISVTPYNVSYDRSPHVATGTAIGVLGEPLTGLNLSLTLHTAVGNYTDPWTFTNANYLNSNGTVNDVIRRSSDDDSHSAAQPATLRQ